jgi:glycosyltransferase involved in cell wall biosynthesis
MKIGIDIRSTLKKRTGIGYYTMDLISALADIDSANEYFLYSYIRPFDFKRRLPGLPSAKFRHRVDRVRLRPETTMRDMDVFHTSSYDITAPGKAKLVTTVHDVVPLIFPGGYSDDYLSGLEGKLRRVLDDSAVVIADSNNTKKDLASRFPGYEGKIEVIYPGKNESFRPVDRKTAFQAIKKKYSIDRQFVLFVGGQDERKNSGLLAEAFRQMKNLRKIPHVLVMIGKFDSARREALRKGMEKDIVFPGYVDRSDMNLFYSACEVFVYPSLYEGFGLPILEAFSSGAPVVTSSTSSCAEIASTAAMTVDPQSTSAIAEAVLNVIQDRSLSDDLRKKGPLRAGEFSWQDSASRFLDVFKRSR